MTEQDMTQQQQQQRFQLRTNAELIQIARNRPADLIDGFVPSGSVMVLAGGSSTGKSFTALSWAAAIAEGSSWFGQQTRQAPVVYVLGEGFSGFGRRIKTWEIFNGRPMSDNLHFMDGLTYGIDLNDPDSVQQLIAMLAYVQPGLVIFDSLSMLARYSNENDNAEVAHVMANVNKIVQATGATAMLVQHIMESTEPMEPSVSVFVGNADTGVVVAEDTRENATGTFLLSTEAQYGGKQRDGEARTLYGFKIDSPGVLSRYGNSATAYPDSNTQPREG